MRPLAALILFIAALSVGTGTEASRNTGDSGGSPTTDGDGNVTVEVNGIQVTRGGGGPKCTCTRLTQGQMERRLGTPSVYVEPEPLPEVDALPDDREPTEDETAAYDTAEQERDDEIERRDAARAAENARLSAPSLLPMTQNGETTPHGMFSAICAGRNINPNFIAINTPRPDIEAALRGQATDQIELPVADINPPLEAGGFVNLGMWLAIVPQAPIEPITAEIPGVWITAYPTHDSVTFTFGDGSDPITCEGAGTPIPDSALDEVDPSPTCGHVYRQSSLDGEPYQLTIDTTWVIPYESSTTSGTLDPYTRSATFDYNVDEIQTLGTG